MEGTPIQANLPGGSILGSKKTQEASQPQNAANLQSSYVANSLELAPPSEASLISGASLSYECARRDLLRISATVTNGTRWVKLPHSHCGGSRPTLTSRTFQYSAEWRSAKHADAFLFDVSWYGINPIMPSAVSTVPLPNLPQFGSHKGGRI